MTLHSHYKLKRALDVVGSFSLFVFSSIVMAVIAFIVWLDSRGPVLYRQVRVGLNMRERDERRYAAFRRSGLRALQFSRRHDHERRTRNLHGKPFPILKFRTMVVDAEKDGPRWCRNKDPRVTRFGNVLRKTHLDELPQLINIMRGDMSLVGPRPERPEFVSTLINEVPSYKKRLSLKPGLTGLAQIRWSADHLVGDVKKKVKYDLLYMKKASLATDLKIIIRTIPVAFGASAPAVRPLEESGNKTQISLDSSFHMGPEK